MKTIWKFKLELSEHPASRPDGQPQDTMSVALPEGAQLLAVQMQGVAPWVWAIVDTDASTVHRKLLTRETGQPFDGTEGDHVGTFQDGPFVWHIFEERE